MCNWIRVILNGISTILEGIYSIFEGMGTINLFPNHEEYEDEDEDL